MKAERVEKIGYINNTREHALISIHDPAIVNDEDRFVQIAISVDAAVKLRDRLDAFLAAHYSGDEQDVLTK
jgi:hypothetical protein